MIITLQVTFEQLYHLFLDGIKIIVTSVAADDIQTLVFHKIEKLKERDSSEFIEEIDKDRINNVEAFDIYIYISHSKIRRKYLRELILGINFKYKG